MDIAAFIDEVRSWIGTPFHHAARSKGIGVDCVGVLIEAARAQGLIDYQNVEYSRLVDPAYLTSEILRFCRYVAIEDRRPGDVLLFAIEGSAQHTGILTQRDPGSEKFVHANQSAGLVSENDLKPVYIRKLAAVFRIKEGSWLK